jgi:hypothetical protein
VTSSSFDSYEAEYQRYEAHLRLWAGGLPQILAKRGTLLLLYVAISNQGDRAAEKVHLQAELTGAFHFEPIELFDNLLEDLLDVPSVPEPYFPGNFRASDFRDERQRVDEFYLRDEPEQEGAAKMISWRCEELRQNTTFSLPALIVADAPGAQGSLTLRTRGALIAKEISLTAPP